MEHRSDSQQMDYRNDLKLRCEACQGRGYWTFPGQPFAADKNIRTCNQCEGTGRKPDRKTR